MLPAARIWLLFFLTKEEIYVKTSKTTSYPANRPFSCVTMFLSTLFFNAHTAYAADGTIDYKAGAKIQ